MLTGHDDRRRLRAIEREHRCGCGGRIRNEQREIEVPGTLDSRSDAGRAETEWFGDAACKRARDDSCHAGDITPADGASIVTSASNDESRGTTRAYWPQMRN